MLSDLFPLDFKIAIELISFFNLCIIALRCVQAVQFEVYKLSTDLENRKLFAYQWFLQEAAQPHPEG